MASRSMITAITMSQVGATSYKRQILPNDKRLQLKGKCATCQMEFLKHRVKRGGKEDVLLTDRHCKPFWRPRIHVKVIPRVYAHMGHKAPLVISIQPTIEWTR